MDEARPFPHHSEAGQSPEKTLIESANLFKVVSKSLSEADYFTRNFAMA